MGIFSKQQVFVSHFEKRRNSRTKANTAELDPGRFETEAEPPMMLEREFFVPNSLGGEQPGFDRWLGDDAEGCA